MVPCDGRLTGWTIGEQAYIVRTHTRTRGPPVNLFAREIDLSTDRTRSLSPLSSCHANREGSARPSHPLHPLPTLHRLHPLQPFADTHGPGGPSAPWSRQLGQLATESRS